jgi:hypothetical protein
LNDDSSNARRRVSGSITIPIAGTFAHPTQVSGQIDRNADNIADTESAQRFS